MKEFIKNTIFQLLEDNNVVNLDRFRKEKRDREDYHGAVLVSKDGMITLDPDEYYYVDLSHRDQADAIVDGDIEAAETLGAKVLDVSKLALEKLRSDNDE